MGINPDKAAFTLSSLSGTLTFLCRARQSQGTGTFSASTPVSFNDLTVTFPNGRNDALTIAVLREACLQHLLRNTAFLAWWSPESGSVEENLRESLKVSHIPPSSANTVQWMLMFDGQFGPVLAA